MLYQFTIVVIPTCLANPRHDKWQLIYSYLLFTADLPFGHTNILKHQPNRPSAQELLFLIQGNHDGFIRVSSNYFKPAACPFHQYARQNYRSEVR